MGTFIRALPGGPKKVAAQAVFERLREEEGRARDGWRRAKAANEMTSNREELLDGAVDLRAARLGQSADDRQRLVEASATMDESQARLQNTLRMLDDTQRIGGAALEELDRQTKTLQNARGNLDEADTTLGRAGKLIRVMSKRAMANKCIMFGVIGCLVLTIILIIYFKWIKKDDYVPQVVVVTATPTPTATPMPSQSPSPSPDMLFSLKRPATRGKGVWRL